MLLEPLRNFRMFCAFTPFGFVHLGRRGDWENYAKTAGFSQMRFYDDKGIGLFILDK